MQLSADGRLSGEEKKTSFDVSIERGGKHASRFSRRPRPVGVIFVPRSWEHGPVFGGQCYAMGTKIGEQGHEIMLMFDGRAGFEQDMITMLPDSCP